MKKLLTFCLLGVALATSCKKKEEDTTVPPLQIPSEQTRDSLAQAVGIVEYTVKVIDWGTEIFRSGLEGVSVSVNQYGLNETLSTDSEGKVLFNDLRTGSADLTVSKNGYVEATITVNLTPTDDDGDKVLQAETIIPIYNDSENSSSYISGQVTGETDLTNLSSEKIEGLKIYANLNLSNDPFAPLRNQETDGKITAYTYTGESYIGYSDALGNYRINVPQNTNGLWYSLSFEDAVRDQKLYDFDKVLFQTYETTRSVLFSLDASPSQIPDVSPVYVEFSQPSGAVGIATDYVNSITNFDYPLNFDGNGGFNGTYEEPDGNGGSITQTLQDVKFGAGYTAPPKVVVEGTGTGASFGTILHTDGTFSVRLNNPGQGYSNGNYSLYFQMSDSREQAKGLAVIEPNTGEILDIQITNPGKGYYESFDITIDNFGQGAGVTFDNSFDNIYLQVPNGQENSGLISSVNIVDGGSNYFTQNTPGNLGINNFNDIPHYNPGYSYYYGDPANLNSSNNIIKDLVAGQTTTFDIYLGSGQTLD